jgi:hypothetical protein
MARDTTVVWHVSPESNIDSILSEGLKTQPCIQTWLDTGNPANPERVTEGVYVTRKRRTMETYAAMCLEDVRQQMDDDEQFALFKAVVSTDRLTTDPESDLDPDAPDAHIHAGDIDDVELVKVCVLE